VTSTNKDRGDLIREHGERLATLEERIENIRRDIDRILKTLETRKERQWSLSLVLIIALVGLVSAVIGGVLTEVFKVLFSKVVS
jgi:uncharacterized membrane protein YoaK (UPF0700 family)